MTKTGPAIFFDGRTTARQEVVVHLTPVALVVRSQEGRELAYWPYDELEQSSTHAGVFRIGRNRGGGLERIEVHEPELAAAIDELSIPVDRTGLTARRSRRKVVLWSVAAVASLLVVGIFGVPELATRLAPYVPAAVERKIGDAVDQQIRTMLNPGRSAEAFECGHSEKEKAGKAALERMVGRLETVAGLPIDLRLKVVRRKEANAMAIPGGYIYVFEGLITMSETADELAGVIAHEIGHVAHRDGMRSILQAGGLAFLFGLVLGDFVGGGAVIIAAKTILQLRYTREVEAQADLYAVTLMEKSGGDARALGKILMRITGEKEPEIKILTNHPATKERAVWINAAARDTAKGSLLDAESFAALKLVCAGP